MGTPELCLHGGLHPRRRLVPGAWLPEPCGARRLIPLLRPSCRGVPSCVGIFNGAHNLWGWKAELFPWYLSFCKCFTVILSPSHILLVRSLTFLEIERLARNHILKLEVKSEQKPKPSYS